MGDEMEGAMQQAPQPGRHSIEQPPFWGITVRITPGKGTKRATRLQHEEAASVTEQDGL
jgi:hypothetical protein